MNGVQRAVEIAGGQSALARLLGSSRQAVWFWLRGDRNISPKFALKIEAETAGQVTREQLRPDIYPPRAA